MILEYGCTQDLVSIFEELGGKMFDNDLCDLLAIYSRWHFAGSRWCVGIVLSPSLGPYLKGCRCQYMKNKRKWFKQWFDHPMYGIIQIHKSHHWVAPLKSELLADLAFRETPPLLGYGTTHCNTIYTGPRLYRKISEEQGMQKQEFKQKIKTASVSAIPWYLNSIPLFLWPIRIFPGKLINHIQGSVKKHCWFPTPEYVVVSCLLNEITQHLIVPPRVKDVVAISFHSLLDYDWE